MKKITPKNDNTAFLSALLKIADAIKGNNFLALTDTPETFIGAASRFLKVNSIENAVEFALANFLELSDTPSSYAGQAAKVVRVNAGANALEFATLSASPSAYECTVGVSGADYTHIGDAVAAGKTRMLVIANTTEDADIAVPAAGLEICLQKDVVVNFGNYSFTYTSAAPVYFYSHSSATLQYANDIVFKNSSYSTALVYMENIIIDNNSTSNAYYVNSYQSIFKAKNIKLELPNYAYSGVQLRNNNSIIDGLWVVGGGSSCQSPILLDNGKIQNLYVTGTFANGSNCVEANNGATTLGILVNILHDTSVTNGLTYTARSIINAFSTVADQLILRTYDSTQSEIINAYNVRTIQPGIKCRVNNVHISYSAGTLILYQPDVFFTNCVFAGSLDLRNDRMLFSNSRLESSLTVGSGYDLNHFDNCIIIGAVSVTGNDATFIGCRVGADAGGGAVTITINAGANRTIICGCRTDAAISDAGTGSVLTGNAVY